MTHALLQVEGNNRDLFYKSVVGTIEYVLSAHGDH